MKRKVLFIDRDGTIIREPADEQIDSYGKFEFLDGAISNLARIARELSFDLVMVTNQDGLGTNSFPEENFWPVQDMMLRILKSEQVSFADIFIDRSFPKDNLPTRKPGLGMLGKYVHGPYDLSNSYVIGDRLTDVELAKNLGSKSIFIGDRTDTGATFVASHWEEIYQYLRSVPRTASIVRRTKETDIRVEVNLDHDSGTSISTGLGFFDHMLEQISRHGGMGLNIQCTGDLHIDEHHTIEDVALAMGSAFREALGDKRGIQRYGFLLPMDDCLAQVAIDFGGRPWLVWDAKFSREKIGEVPTELFYHFFKSFSDTAQCNLNIKAEGENEHHKIESIFKAFAKSIRMAVSPSGSSDIPSTKGSL